jgi:Cof subfamily protein (haloacid dehalogenase superfamily)
MGALSQVAEASARFPYRLAAVDLDGTLLSPDKSIGAANLAAVRRLQDNGAEVIIASGRRHQNSVRFQRELGLRGPIIACQGGLIRDGESGNVIEAHFLPQGVAHEIVAFAEQEGIPVIYYHLDHLYVSERHNRWIDLYESRVGERAEAIGDLAQLDGRRALKIVWYAQPEQLRELRPQLSERFAGKVDLLSTERENLEFMPPRITKASALAKVAETLGVKQAEVVAFGDSENDVPMLQWAGLGIAMAHGADMAKTAASMTSPAGPPQDAFARAVDALMQGKFA